MRKGFKMGKQKVKDGKESANHVESFETLQKCALTEKETLAYAKEMAELSGEMRTLEGDAKAAAQEFKSRIAGKQARFSTISQRVQNGSEFRPVKCERVFDYEKREVREYRLDSGAMVSCRSMTDAEAQGDLGI